MKLQNRNFINIIKRQSQDRYLTQFNKQQRITEAAFQKSNISNANEQNNSQFIKKIRRKWLMLKFARELKALIPFNYQKTDNFQQQWQKQEEFEDDQQSKSFLFHFSDKIFLIFEILTFVLNIIMIWYLTIFVTFEMEAFSNFQIIWKINCLLSIIINLNTIKVNDNKLIFNRKYILKIYLQTQGIFDLVIFIYIFLQISNINKHLLHYIQILLIFTISIKAKKNMDKIQPLYQNFLEKQYITLIHSFLFLFMMGHIFAIIMFAASKLNEDVNWVLAANISHKSWSVQYIYSLYWAFTTIVTVGYGDITPKNEYQIIIVIIIQILGTSLFGYMINIIGIMINQIKKHDETLQKQLRISEKIAKCFELTDELSYQLKMNIRNNKKIDKSFSILQQKQVLDNIHPQLRHEIFRQTNTKIIKKCIFFLTHFTREFQTKISLKLIKKILQPREQIIQTFGEQSFYIIHKGIIHVHSIIFHQNNRIQKRIKCIKKIDSQDVSSNVYGYTAAITGRTVKLIASSNDFTIAYELKKKDFKQLLLKYPSDNQASYQLHDMFLQVPILESIEAPKLNNYKFHYIPNKLVIIKRKNRQNQKQIRQFRRRADMKKIKTYLYINDENPINNSKQSVKDEKFSLRYTSSKRLIQIRQNQTSQTQDFQSPIELLENKNISIDCIKTYQKYFIRFNIQRVLQKYRSIKQKTNVNNRFKR